MKPRLFAMLTCGLALAVAAALHAQQSPASAAPGSLTLETTTSPAGSNTAEPQITTDGSHTVLSWLELSGIHSTLKFAEATAAGWTAARTAATGDDFMVNSSDVPSVRRLTDGTLVAEWLQQDGPDPESYKMRLSWSHDDGRTWSAPIYPHHDTVVTQHGFGSLFDTPGGGFGVVWLDGRAIPPDADEGVGNMQLRAATFDRSGKQLGDTVVDSRVCECCPTSTATTADGVVVAYRNRSASEVRDIYVTRLANGRWTTPVAVHHDDWKVDACPVNGPAVSAHGRDLVVSWFTAKGGTGHSYVAFSHDDGQTFSAPTRIDEASSLGRAGVVLLDDGSAVASWVEFSKEHSAFMARRVDAHGQRGPALRVGDSSGTRIPRLARYGNDLVFAWTASVDNQPRIETARARIP